MGLKRAEASNWDPSTVACLNEALYTAALYPELNPTLNGNLIGVALHTSETFARQVATLATVSESVALSLLQPLLKATGMAVSKVVQARAATAVVTHTHLQLSFIISLTFSSHSRS